MPVAQLDRVTGYEPVGRGFESLQARLEISSAKAEDIFIFRKISEEGNFLISLQKKLDTSQYLWCDEAVLIQVKNGKSALTEICSEFDDENYTEKANLMLNGKPLLQGEYPFCPTCSAWLARGYGIEHIDCPELKKIRHQINAEYENFQTAVENIAPLLELLDDGFYVVADAKVYPTNGEEHYFANVPDELAEQSAACNRYYSSAFFTVTKGFPAYLYPTQSNSVLNLERAEYYADIIDKKNAPRAIAYHEYGFLCALLDGHHKAYAAAKKGCMLSTLVIIPMSGTVKRADSSEELAFFSEICIPAKELSGFKGIRPKIKKRVKFSTYENIFIDEKNLNIKIYPTIEELTGIYAAGAEHLTITENLIQQWLESPEQENHNRLLCVLKYYAKTKPEQAYQIAKKIISFAVDNGELKTLLIAAYRVISGKKCEESENLILEYIINHDKTNSAWEVCTSYWEDE